MLIQDVAARALVVREDGIEDLADRAARCLGWRTDDVALQVGGENDVRHQLATGRLALGQWQENNRKQPAGQTELGRILFALVLYNAKFPVLADTACRNTVCNAVARSAAEFVPRMKAIGLRHYRVELLREEADQVGPLLERYARVLAGLNDGRHTWRLLQSLNQLGVTRGTLQLV